MDQSLEYLFAQHGVKATANRLRIARALDSAGRPLSVSELETMLETIDKSNIFRALTLFHGAHLVHALEDNGDGVRYELCHAHHHDEDGDDDLHVHFWCSECHKTFCLDHIPVPQVEVPEGYVVQSASHLLKGLCPACAQRNKNLSLQG
ncbi:MAG: transcriptional repressor [Bacteroidales bacterium]|nr:transcriptional repressor [Bacteroidales bacterium]MBP5374459.1 transcriptional repressor [Bacteroidales bacterium]